MVHGDGAVGLDAVEVVFDDENAVANAGIVLVSTLAGRLGIEQLADECVDLTGRPGAGNEGAKVMTLVSAMALGADCIDDVDVLRAGRTADLLGHRVLAPSTIGTFVRSFTFGHVRQLDRLLGEVLGRAWTAGAGPGDGRLSSTLTPSSVGSSASKSTARRSATPESVAITRSWRPAPIPAKSSRS